MLRKKALVGLVGASALAATAAGVAAGGYDPYAPGAGASVGAAGGAGGAAGAAGGSTDVAAIRAERQQASMFSMGMFELNLLGDVDSMAVCNDGSPAGYYFSPSPSGPSAPWIIYLMGGDWCYDEESCRMRMQATAFQVSSSGWKKWVALDGVMSPQSQNPFSTWNKVYIEYCSSDAWMGDVGASAATFDMNFRGQRIIAATLSDLAASQGLPAGADVVFGGCSAGARGAMVTLDNVASMLPSGARVRGLLDSGLWLDRPLLDPGAEISLQQQAQLVVQLYAASSVFPAACAAQNAGSDLWRCIYGQYRMPYVSSQYFVNVASYDSFQMVYDMGGNVPHTAGQVLYADGYAQATQEEMESLVGGGNGVFSTTCLAHCLTQELTMMTSYTAGGQTIAQALAQWLQGGSPADISTCQGYATCVQECPGGSQTLDLQEAIANSSPELMEEEEEHEAARAQSAQEVPGAAAGPGAAGAGAGQPGAGAGAAAWPFQSTQPYVNPQVQLAQQNAAANNWMMQGRHRKALR